MPLRLAAHTACSVLACCALSGCWFSRNAPEGRPALAPPNHPVTAKVATQQHHWTVATSMMFNMDFSEEARNGMAEAFQAANYRLTIAPPGQEPAFGTDLEVTLNIERDPASALLVISMNTLWALPGYGRDNIDLVYRLRGTVLHRQASVSCFAWLPLAWMPLVTGGEGGQITKAVRDATADAIAEFQRKGLLPVGQGPAVAMPPRRPDPPPPPVSSPPPPPAPPPPASKSFWCTIDGKSVLKTEAETRALPPDTPAMPQDQAGGWSTVGRLFPGATPPAGSAPGLAAEPVETPAGPTRTYTVQAGDTLKVIAARELGSAEAWKAIAAANPGLDIRKPLVVGQQVQLPPKP